MSMSAPCDEHEPDEETRYPAQEVHDAACGFAHRMAHDLCSGPLRADAPTLLRVHDAYHRLAVEHGAECAPLAPTEANPDLERYAAHHAPEGGVTIDGKPYAGGEFIPLGEVAKADSATRDAILGGPGKTGDHHLDGLLAAAKLGWYNTAHDAELATPIRQVLKSHIDRLVRFAPPHEQHGGRGGRPRHEGPCRRGARRGERQPQEPPPGHRGPRRRPHHPGASGRVPGGRQTDRG